MKISRNVLSLGLAILGLTLGAAPRARAGFIAFETAPGATEASGLAVKGRVTFTTGAGTITVVITNQLSNPKSVAQGISDLIFKVSTGQSTGTLTFSSAAERTINSGGTFTDGGTVATGWVLTSSAGAFHLDDLAAGGAGPKHVIIGSENTVTGKYDNANSSIAGNGPHNPFLNQTATFVLSVTGVTADSSISSAVFSFGTETGNNVTLRTVPEPGSFALLGAGGLGLAAFARRRRKAVGA